jgi:CheY-like chemotaxis protein
VCRKGFASSSGKATGLGLSTVYGIVKQSGGYIRLYSEVGKGSCFKLYFPKIDKQVTTVAAGQPSTSEGHGETILLVEDEDAVRESVGEYLRRYGYLVLEACNGQHAMEVVDRHKGPIHLLLTDVIMPKMGGPELARELVSRNRIAATLFMSGYTDDAIVNLGLVGSGVAFIQKPFSYSALTTTIQQIIVFQKKKEDTVLLDHARQNNTLDSLASTPIAPTPSILD